MEWRGSRKIIPRGTEFAIRSRETIDSRMDFVGQLFVAVIERNILDDKGVLIIPNGADAELVLQRAKGTGPAGSVLVLDLEAVTLAGLRYLVITGDMDEKAHPRILVKGKAGAIVGRGWALGALNGAIANGAKSVTAIANTGADTDAADQLLTKGDEVRVPAGALLNFTLEIEVRLEPCR